MLPQEKATILKHWFDLVVETYPPETARFLRKESNQFANPVGHTIHHGMEGLLEEFLHEMNPEKMSSLLDRIIRIRAVQNFLPSQAIAFILQLKKVVREVFGREIQENRVSPDDLQSFDSKVDALSLLAFDVYMGCRENLYEVRINEVKNRTSRLLQRANIIAEISDDAVGPEGKNT